ncbi:MAG: ABC transporter permease [Candidatus Thorarchaeota archaeon]
MESTEANEKPRFNLVSSLKSFPRTVLAFLKSIPKTIGATIENPTFQKQVIATIGSIILAMLIAAIVMLMAGYNAGLGFIALIRAAIVQWDRVLFNATPLIFTGLSVALAFRCGLFNIGPEGQLYVGALAAAIVGFTFTLPFGIHPIACLLIGAVVGGLWGFLPGILKAYRGAHEVVTTMMLSYTALLLTFWLIKFPFDDPSNESLVQTIMILPSAELPAIYGSFLSWAFFVALITVLGVWFLLNRTVLGYEMRAVGLNINAAEFAGINSKKTVALSLGLAGAIAGMGGAAEIIGYHHRFRDNWSTGLGWDGITVAVLGFNNPFGVLLAALFFGALRTGGNSMQLIAKIPVEMVILIQGLIVLFVAGPRVISWIQEKGYAELKLLTSDTKTGMPHFLLLGVTVVSSILGMVLVSTFTQYSTMLGIMVFLSSIICLSAFILLFMQKDSGFIVAIAAGIEWILIALSGIIFGVDIILIGTLIAAVLLVFPLLSLVVFDDSKKNEGGTE